MFYSEVYPFTTIDLYKKKYSEMKRKDGIYEPGMEF